MDYAHLTDAELIHYATIDALPGSLAHLVATRFEANIEGVAAIENQAAEEIAELERKYEAVLDSKDELRRALDSALLS
jgi:predicted  nucleic acid-binding Zn-ribbon protein